MIDYTNKNRAATGAIASERDEGLRAYMQKVFNTMGLGLLTTGVIAFLISGTQLGAMIATPPLFLFLILVELGLVWYLSARAHTMPEGKARSVFYLYAALNGLTFSLIFLAYTGESIARTFFITAAMFGAMSLYGYTTKRDLTGWGSFLFMGLIGLIITMIVNIFLQSPIVHFIASAIGVLIFTGLTAYDTQKIKEIYYYSAGNIGGAVITGALTLYLDFINLMIYMLKFLGNRRD